MKLIKKIAAIMFAFMMVVSMSCNVKADGAVNNSQGSITIDNAKEVNIFSKYPDNIILRIFFFFNPNICINPISFFL